MYLPSSLALLAVVTVPATSRSVPTAVVSATTRRAASIATYFGDKARLHAQEEKQNRRMIDVADFGDFNDFFGDADDMNIGSELCPFLSLSDYYDDDFDDEKEVEEEDYYGDLFIEDFMESCNVECDVAKESIVTTCNFTDQQVCDDQGEFCIDDMVVTATVPFDLHEISGEVCMTYTTAPADMLELQGKEGCISIEMEMDMVATLQMAFDPDVDPEDFGDAMQITDCGFTLGDEVCDCNVCDNGLGGDLTCPDTGVISEDCAAIDGLSDLEDASEIGDIASSVVRFTRMESEGGGLRR